MYLRLILERTAMRFGCLVSGWERVISCNTFLRLSFPFRTILFWSSNTFNFSALAVFSFLTMWKTPSPSCIFVQTFLLAEQKSSPIVMTSSSHSEEQCPREELSTVRKACQRDWVAFSKPDASIGSEPRTSSTLSCLLLFRVCALCRTAIIEEIQPRTRPRIKMRIHTVTFGPNACWRKVKN